jgi:DNA-binding NtrC family response regulator
MAAAHRVLVADDHPEIRQLLAHVVETRLGANVVTVEDGGEALYKLEEEGYDFDLLLLEVDMPRATGLDVLSAMSSIRPEVPVVLTSGRYHHEQAAMDLGARAFLRKPFELAQLTAVLSRVLEPRPQVLSIAV